MNSSYVQFCVDIDREFSKYFEDLKENPRSDEISRKKKKGKSDE